MFSKVLVSSVQSTAHHQLSCIQHCQILYPVKKIFFFQFFFSLISNLFRKQPQNLIFASSAQTLKCIVVHMQKISFSWCNKITMVKILKNSVRIIIYKIFFEISSFLSCLTKKFRGNIENVHIYFCKYQIFLWQYFFRSDFQLSIVMCMKCEKCFPMLKQHLVNVLEVYEASNYF